MVFSRRAMRLGGLLVMLSRVVVRLMGHVMSPYIVDWCWPGHQPGRAP
jgi:hypothetical protein